MVTFVSDDFNSSILLIFTTLRFILEFCVSSKPYLRAEPVEALAAERIEPVDLELTLIRLEADVGDLGRELEVISFAVHTLERRGRGGRGEKGDSQIGVFVFFGVDCGARDSTCSSFRK